ncbi:MAG: DUF1549 domain-containing protein, partial [Planctomycetia bacterium]
MTIPDSTSVAGRRLTLAALLLLAATAGSPFAVEPPAKKPPVKPAPVSADHAEKMAKGMDLFKKQVRPVLVQNCLKCHGGRPTLESGFDLTDRDRLLAGGDGGPAVVVGKSADSRLYKMAAHLEEPGMPYKGRKLPDDALAAVARWIDLGAPYDAPLVDRAAAAGARVSPEAREFWSFRPLSKTEPPTRPDDAWSKTTVDRYIVAKLDEHKLKPNPSADRRTLIRRATYDLVGLPPTPAAVDAFLADQAPDAYERLIDGLLARPQYGERWARFWMDVARFAESHGYEQDYDRPHAYHYRDFLIRALNDDLPFDRFVRFQLAGDELAPNDPYAQAATGFLGGGAFPTQLTEAEFESARYDELDDMA